MASSIIFILTFSTNMAYIFGISSDIGKEVTARDLELISELSQGLVVTYIASLVGVIFGLYSILALYRKSDLYSRGWWLLTIAYILVVLVGAYLYLRWAEHTALFWFVADELKTGEFSLKEKHDYIWDNMMKEKIPWIPPPLNMPRPFEIGFAFIIPAIVAFAIVVISWFAVAIKCPEKSSKETT